MYIFFIFGLFYASINELTLGNWEETRESDWLNMQQSSPVVFEPGILS